MKKEKNSEILPLQIYLNDIYEVNLQESCTIIKGYSEKVAEQAAILNFGLKNKDYLGLSLLLGENSEIADNIVTNKEYFFKLAGSYGIELAVKVISGEVSHDILEDLISKDEEIPSNQTIFKEMDEDILIGVISQYLLDHHEGEPRFKEMFEPFTKGFNYLQDKEGPYRAKVTDSAHHDEHMATRSLDKA